MPGSKRGKLFLMFRRAHVAEVTQEERRDDFFGELAERYIAKYAKVKNKPGTFAGEEAGHKNEPVLASGVKAENHQSYQGRQPENPAKVPPANWWCEDRPPSLPAGVHSAPP
jgi:hypothetical protein